MEDEKKEIKMCKKEKTEYKAEVFAYRDTCKQLLVRSRYLFFKKRMLGQLHKNNEWKYSLNNMMTSNGSTIFL